MSERKYPETSSFLYHNANFKGLTKAGDCVIRAIATALDQTWEQTVRELAEVSIRTGYMLNMPQCYGKYLEEKGWKKQKQPRKADNSKYTGREWCTWLSVNDPHGETGNIIANIGSYHTVAIVPTNHGDGINSRFKVLDTWDSTRGCIGNYWVSK
jgi:hypothetical protein